MFLRFIQSNKFLLFLFSLVVLFLPTQIGKHFWPEFAFVAGLRIDYLSPTVYFSDIVSIAFIIVSFIKYRQKVFIPVLFYVAMLLFSISIFVSKNPLAGWYILAKFIEFFLLGKAFVFFFSEKDPLSFLLPFFMGTTVLESILSLWQVLLQSSVGNIFYFLGERTFTAETPGIANASVHGTLFLRPYGTFSHPNVLAGFLVLSLTLFLYGFTRQHTKPLKILLLLISTLATITLFFSLSRIAIVVWILVLVGFLLFTKKTKAKTFLFVFILLILGFVFLSPIRDRFFAFSLSEESATDRLTLLYIAWQMFLSHPLFGVGFGNFFGELPAMLSLQKHTVLLLQPVHNIFFLLLSETGITGCAISVYFLYKTITRGIILYKNANRNQKGRYVFYFLLLGEVLVLGQTDHYFLTLQQGQLLLTLILSLFWSNFKTT